MHLAYQWVLVAMMLAEANHAVQVLELSEPKPITRTELEHIFVTPPELQSQGGRIDTKNYSFCFEKERLQYIYKMNPFGDLGELQAIQRMLKNGDKAVIGTNDAYRMATNWLNLLSVDVYGLEKVAPARPKQGVYFEQGTTPRPFPIFDVEWGEQGDPRVKVRIDGRTREMIYIRIEEGGLAFYHRPQHRLKERDALVSIADATFSNYSAAEKDALLFRFLDFSGISPKSTPR